MRTANIDADFREFDAANPRVWELFRKFNNWYPELKLFELRALREERAQVAA